MSDEPEKKLPRIICDRCMKDAEVTAHCGSGMLNSNSALYLIRCHDTEELAHAFQIDGGGVKVWANIAHLFIEPTVLLNMERNTLGRLLAGVTELALIHRVRRAQGAGPLYAEVDEAVDTLLLFREDKP